MPLTQIYPEKFDALCFILSKFFNKPVELNLIRVHYPYSNANILVNFFNLFINHVKLIKVMRRFFRKMYLRNFVSGHFKKNFEKSQFKKIKRFSINKYFFKKKFKEIKKYYNRLKFRFKFKKNNKNNKFFNVNNNKNYNNKNKFNQFYFNKNEKNLMRNKINNKKNNKNLKKKLFNLNQFKNRFIKKKNNNIMKAKKQTLIPSFLTGINIKVAGRLLTNSLGTRRTVRRFKRGINARGLSNYIDRARFTGKNTRGAYSISINSSHRFFNNK